MQWESVLGLRTLQVLRDWALGAIHYRSMFGTRCSKNWFGWSIGVFGSRRVWRCWVGVKNDILRSTNVRSRNVLQYLVFTTSWLGGIITSSDSVSTWRLNRFRIMERAVRVRGVNITSAVRDFLATFTWAEVPLLRASGMDTCIYADLIGQYLTSAFWTLLQDLWEKTTVLWWWCRDDDMMMIRLALAALVGHTAPHPLSRGQMLMGVVFESNIPKFTSVWGEG